METVLQYISYRTAPRLSALSSSWFFEQDCGGEDLRLTSGLELSAQTLLVWAYSLTNGVP